MSLALAVACLCTSGFLPAASSAQPAPAEGAEQATIALLPYMLPPDAAPAGYAAAPTRGWTNSAAAIEAVTVQPIDPRPAGAMLEPLVANGRVIRLRQDFDPLDAPEAAGLLYNAVLFRDDQSAARAFRNPSLLFYLFPSDRITPIEAPALGDESAGLLIERDEVEESFHVVQVVWRRGRVVFAVGANGTPEAVSAALPTVIELAQWQAQRIGSLPMLPGLTGAPPPYMPSEAKQLELYRALAERTPPDDVLGADTGTLGVGAISNAALVLGGLRASGVVADPGLLYERLVARERRILGVAKEIETLPEASAANPPDSPFPDVSFGYHLYADADGADEALRAPVDELALRASLEIVVGRTRELTLADVPPTMSIGEQVRALRGSFTASWDPSSTIELHSIRWRRGAVELFVDVAVAPGTDVAALIGSLVELLDETYSPRPIEGF